MYGEKYRRDYAESWWRSLLELEPLQGIRKAGVLGRLDASPEGELRVNCYLARVEPRSFGSLSGKRGKHHQPRMK